MPSNIETLLQDKKEDTLDYNHLLKKFPWIVEDNHYCILSPDSDGFLCGLLMSAIKNWKIIGFYDDKLAVINKNYLQKNPIFLDGEIFRKGIRSMGHHMLLVNKNKKPSNFDEGFSNCIQPNLFRNYDKNTFRLKYPLATIHLLASIIAFSKKDSDNPLIIPESAIPPLFFTDGVFQVLFKYPENVLNWLHYLRIHEDWNPLKKIFENDSYTVFTLMKEMNDFFRERDKISINKERGDRLKLSDTDGKKYNIIESNTGFCHIRSDAKNRAIQFLSSIGKRTSWTYKEKDWQCWENLQFFKFTKGNFKSDKKRITIKAFQEFIERDPLSWAMTSGDNIEYTLEFPHKFSFDIYKPNN